jgi:hypothetical protein
MRFEARTFSLAKDAEFPEQTQDAFALNSRRGVAVVADGAAMGLFSGMWARQLCRAIVLEPPDLDAAAEFQAWLAAQRAAWWAQIDVEHLPFYQRAKLPDGGASTVLWIELGPTVDEPPSRPTRCQLYAVALGDSCLFHLRGDELLHAFPVEDESGFGIDPPLLGSIDFKQDHQLEFQILEDECLTGDLLVLCTDAVALWATKRRAAREPVDWYRYWDMPYQAWKDEVGALRNQSRMRYDDNTLVLLRVLDDVEAPAERLEIPPQAVASRATSEPGPAEPQIAVANLTGASAVPSEGGPIAIADTGPSLSVPAEEAVSMAGEPPKGENDVKSEA